MNPIPAQSRKFDQQEFDRELRLLSMSDKQKKTQEMILQSLKTSAVLISAKAHALDWNAVGFTLWSDSMLCVNLGDARTTVGKWRRIAYALAFQIARVEHIAKITKNSRREAALARTLTAARRWANIAVADKPTTPSSDDTP